MAMAERGWVVTTKFYLIGDTESDARNELQKRLWNDLTGGIAFEITKVEEDREDDTYYPDV